MADVTQLRRARPQSSPSKTRASIRPQSALVGPRKSRPASAPARATWRASGTGNKYFGEAYYSFDSYTEATKDWIPGDWTAGWSPHPYKEGAPRWTIPSSDKAKGHDNPGFRDTYLSMFSRSKQNVPGPGAHKAVRDFVPLDVTDAFGKPDHSGKAEKRWTPRHLRSHDDCQWEAGANREAPDPKKGGDQTDAKGLKLNRPPCARIPTQVRNASLTDLRQACPRSLPSSFSTPGPGAYSQFSTFGMPSGACTKVYMGKLASDNPAGAGRLQRQRDSIRDREFNRSSSDRRRGISVMGGHHHSIAKRVSSPIRMVSK